MKRQICKFWRGDDPRSVQTAHDPHGLEDIAIFIYCHTDYGYDSTDGFSVAKSKHNGFGYWVTISAYPDIWEKAKREFEVFSRSLV